MKEYEEVLIENCSPTTSQLSVIKTMGYYFCPFVFGATIVFAVFFLIFMKALNVNFKDLFRRKVKPTNVTEGDQYLNIGVSRPSVVRTKIRMVMFFSDNLASTYRSFKSIIMIR